MTEWTLEYFMEKNPLPANGSRGQSAGARQARSRWVKTIRNRTIAKVEEAGIPPLELCQVRLTWFVTTKRTRDVDNLAALEKPMFDGLVRAGVVADDKPELMRKHRAEIIHVTTAEAAPHGGTAWFELWVAPWERPRTIDELAKQLDIELLPWQRDFANAVLAGENPVLSLTQRSGVTTLRRFMAHIDQIQPQREEPTMHDPARNDDRDTAAAERADAAPDKPVGARHTGDLEKRRAKNKTARDSRKANRRS